MQHSHTEDSQSQSSSDEDDQKAPPTECAVDSEHRTQGKGKQQQGSASKRAEQPMRAETDAGTEN